MLGKGFYILVFALLLTRWLLIEPYKIPSESMVPSLLVNDHILINKFSYGVRQPFSKKWIKMWGSPERGDVVVFRSVNDDSYFMVKRVIGLPGDKVKFSESGDVFLNGKNITKRIMSDSQTRESQDPYYFVTQMDLAGPYRDFVIKEELLPGAKSYRAMLKADSYRWSFEEVTVPEGRLFMLGDYRDSSRDSRVWGMLPVENLMGKAMFVWLSCEETLESVPFICNPLRLRWRRFFHWIR